MSIGRRIAFGFGACFLALVFIGSVIYNDTQNLFEETRWVTHTHQVIGKLDEVFGAMRDQESGMRGYIITGNDDFLEVYRLGQSTLRPALDQLGTMIGDNDAQTQRLRDMQVQIANVMERWSTLQRERDSKGAEAAVALFNTGFTKRVMDSVRATVKTMVEAESQLLRTRALARERAADSTMQTVVYGTLVAASIVLFLGVLVGRSITGPLRVLTDGAAQLGAGNLEHRIPLKNNSDETGVLADAINKMAENLGKTMVTAETERQGRERVEGLLRTLGETADSLVSSTSEILAATTQQAAGAQQQAAAVAETVTTVNEVVQTSEQAAERARMVADIAQKSLDVGKAGRRVVDESVQMMGVVKEQVEASTEGILSLSEQAQSIGTIIASVTEIAEQTNLLALNAAIEASRAGEQGRGFSVVAAEIKALAGQSKKATSQVRQILSEIQRATNGAVMSTEQSTKSVNSAMKVIATAGDTIRQLADVISQASQAAAQISASAGQQAAGTSQIHQAMQNINQVTSQNLGSTRQMEQAARDLSILGGRLRERLAGAGAERGSVGQK
jgi:methyl-accepting chemotaxis protein